MELSPVSPLAVAAQGCLEPGCPGSRTTLKFLFSYQMFSVWMGAAFFVGEGNVFSFYHPWKAGRFGSPAIKPGSHVKAMVGDGYRLPWDCLNPPCGAGLKASPCWDQRWASWNHCHHCQNLSSAPSWRTTLSGCIFLWVI